VKIQLVNAQAIGPRTNRNPIRTTAAATPAGVRWDAVRIASRR
jgi:hypothetical protein